MITAPGKLGAGKGAANDSVDAQEEIERLMDQVPVPASAYADIDQLTRSYLRMLRRVRRWAESKPRDLIVMALAEALHEKWISDREQLRLVDALARDRAESKLQRVRARRGKGHGFWAAVEADWNAWQDGTVTYSRTREFEAGMELKYPGLNGGTMRNRIGQWRRRREARNGVS